MLAPLILSTEPLVTAGVALTLWLSLATPAWLACRSALLALALGGPPGRPDSHAAGLRNSPSGCRPGSGGEPPAAIPPSRTRCRVLGAGRWLCSRLGAAQLGSLRCVHPERRATAAIPSGWATTPKRTAATSISPAIRADPVWRRQFEEAHCHWKQGPIAEEVRSHRNGFRFGLQFLRDHPGQAVRLIPGKIYYLYFTDTSSLYSAVLYAPQTAPSTVMEAIRSHRRVAEMLTYRYYWLLLLGCLVVVGTNAGGVWTQGRPLLLLWCSGPGSLWPSSAWTAITSRLLRRWRSLPPAA